MTTILNASCLFTLIQQFDKLNHKAFLEFLVKREPSLLLEAAANVQQLVPGFVAPWIAEVMHLLSVGAQIAAIKLIRQTCELGLKEAKDVTDTLQGKTEFVSVPMGYETQRVLNMFKSAGLFVETVSAVVTEPIKERQFIYIVRDSDDKSIDTVYSTRTAADERILCIKKMYPHCNQHITAHTVY